VKLLYQRMLDLRVSHRGTPLAAYFPKPIFQIVVLYVEEKESVERQLKRGREIVAHNERVRETGVGVLLEERATDMSEEACRKRYRVFMEQTYSVLQSLKEVFHFHVINAQGDIASVERAINSESVPECSSSTKRRSTRSTTSRLRARSWWRHASTSSSASSGTSATPPTSSSASSPSSTRSSCPRSCCTP
jgi:hypothetical protein